jgi:uncharacterized protein YehS (DUF1456 family)
MHTYTKQQHLNDIDTNDIGEHIEDFGDETLNKAFGKFCIMDDEMSFHKVLTDEMGYNDDEVDASHLDIVQKAVEETLKQVNLVFRNLGIALEFKQADMVEYTAYMLTGKGDTEEDMGVRIRRLVDGKTV